MKKKGFTLVELLVVIAIIVLLSTVAVVALSSTRNSSKITKAQADLKQALTTIAQAQSANNTALRYITGSTCSDCACRGTDLRNIAESSACAVTMKAAWDSMASILGTPPYSVVPRDPWGSPYCLDENEAEGAGMDSIISVGPNGFWQMGADDIVIYVPKYGI